MTDAGAKLIATHMLLPAWWIRAFEPALIGEESGPSAIEQSLKAHLSPAFNPMEMGALAAVMSAMQEQILGGQYRSLRLEVSRYIKEAGAGAGIKTKRYAYEKMAQILTSIKILEPTSFGFSGHSIFAGDAWSLNGSSGRDVVVKLDPSRNGLELILGLSDAHAGLLSILQRQKAAEVPLGSHGPLMLWKSLWLELTGIEPLLYLRLEKAMQWDFKWLQLDGTFGIAMEELFRGTASDFKKQLKALSRLGKRFEGHGFMATVKSDQYLAFSREEDQEPTLVWQIGRERLASEALSTYRALAQRSLVTYHFGTGLLPGALGSNTDNGHACEKLIRLFLSKDTSQDEVNSAKNAWSELYKAAYDTSRPGELRPCIEGLEHEPSQLLSPLGLFFELLLRSVADDHGSSSDKFLCVPEVIVHSPIGSLFNHQNQLSLAERYLAFTQLLDDSPDLIQAFRSHPLATLTSKVSQTDRKVMAILEERSRSSVGHEGLAKPVLIVPRESEEAKKPQTYATKPREKNTIPQTPKEPSAPPSPTPSPSPQGNLPAASASSRMLKIASDELQKIKKNHPDQYTALKKAYLDSLDDEGRKVIFDVQKRMQAHLFEEHLRQRLLRFMVENPGAWRSAEPSYAKNP